MEVSRCFVNISRSFKIDECVFVDGSRDIKNYNCIVRARRARILHRFYILRRST